MWATKHKVACMESGNLGKWRPGPTSSTPPWKLFSWLWDWTLLLKKIKLQKWQQQQQQKRHLQIGDNRTINFFVLRDEKIFPNSTHHSNMETVSVSWSSSYVLHRKWGRNGEHQQALRADSSSVLSVPTMQLLSYSLMSTVTKTQAACLFSAT